jgi:diaminohydroxyphosphoribosylaminopyrimidine deaminase/5-amino-6-(5-phosphoribosylamino)uracil reductase
MAFMLRPDIPARIDDASMRQAFELALRGRGRTSPNPSVGAVIVRDGRVVGSGFHPQAGQPHAEVFALAEAGGSAAGATMYVTLEPCLHHGRTPPCADAIVTAGLASVIVGMPDPTESGGGATALRASGIDVREWPDPTPFEWLAEGWLTRISTGRPFVRVKTGVSLDARPSLAPGERSAMTGPSGAACTRALRATHDAVMVGASTVIADDPSLTVRDETNTLAEHQPLRIVLVRDRMPPADAQVFTDGIAPTLVLAADSTPADALARIPEGVLVERYAVAGGVGEALGMLGRRGLNDLLVEPGPALLTTMWHEQVIDEHVMVTAGGMAGPEAPDLVLAAPDRTDTELEHVMAPAHATVVGDVAVVAWRPVFAAQTAAG